MTSEDVTLLHFAIVKTNRSKELTGLDQNGARAGWTFLRLTPWDLNGPAKTSTLSYLALTQERRIF